MNLINSTLHNAASFVLMDHTGADTLLIVSKSTWAIGKDGRLSVADEQMPIISEPVYAGEPGKSCLLHDTDIVLQKPGTDCVMFGHAWAQESRAPYVDVSFSVGPVNKKLRVFGERRWSRNRVGMASIQKMAPIEKLALTWENAFGGADTSWHDPALHEFCLENPVGRGFMAAKSNIDYDGQLLPEIENPVDLITKPGQRPKPVGFGMIAPYWQPRARYAGAYDENWRKHINPLLPADFDLRFNSSAASGLCATGHLTGAEQVRIEGACRSGLLCFDLHGVRPNATAGFRHREDDIDMRLDTVMIEPDESRLVMTWRGAICIHGRVNDVLYTRVA